MKEDDEGLLSAFRRFEQHGGNPLLRLCGYHVAEKWECEFREEKKTDAALKAFLDDLDMVRPLDPQDAFYGGRTGAVSLYAKAEEGETIKYCDVTSLYPWVNKYKEYPVRCSLIYTNPSDQEIDHYFGLAQVDILAPQHLFHLILPVLAGCKLTFPLCSTRVRVSLSASGANSAKGKTNPRRMLSRAPISCTLS